MDCPNCKHNRTDVADIARHSGVYKKNKGKYYLWKWGVEQLTKSGESAHTPFTARIRKCPRCSYKYRTVELADLVWVDKECLLLDRAGCSAIAGVQGRT